MWLALVYTLARSPQCRIARQYWLRRYDSCCNVFLRIGCNEEIGDMHQDEGFRMTDMRRIVSPRNVCITIARGLYRRHTGSWIMHTTSEEFRAGATKYLVYVYSYVPASTSSTLNPRLAVQDDRLLAKLLTRRESSLNSELHPLRAKIRLLAR